MNSVSTAKAPVARKRAEILAEQIENEIIEAGWPVGKVLGSEADLCERYEVSRAVFREGIRIVGHHGVAEMRRGPGGGLVVVEPNVDAAVRTVLLNLEFRDISPGQINEARLAIELACVRSAIKNLDAAGEERIRAFLTTETASIMSGRGPDQASDDFATNHFHLLLAELTGNPAMVLFVQILSRVTSRHSSPTESIQQLRKNADEVHRVHARIADAVLARDVATAERRVERHLNSIVQYLRP